VFGPNPDLVPEQIRTFEFGAEYRFSSNLSAKADVYRSRIEHFIAATLAGAPPPAPPQYRYENHPDEATITGLELELRWSAANRITGFANYSAQSEDAVHGTRDSTGMPLEFTYAPAHKFNVGTYFGPFDRVRGAFELQWKGEYVGPQMWYLINSGFTDPTIRPLPGYTLANARVSYDLPFASGPAQTPTRLVFYVKNIFDKRPEETLIGVDSRIAGREVFGGLTFGF
jgi:outer membrane receptor protein involved in Fe transport